MSPLGGAVWTRLRRPLLIGLLAVGLGAVGFAGLTALQLWNAWRGIERFGLDIEAGRERLPPVPTTAAVGAATTTSSTAPPRGAPQQPTVSTGAMVAGLGDDDVDVFVVVGSDGDKPFVTIARADAILVFIRPHVDAGPVLTSLPRDLYLPDRCTGAPARISEALAGCGDVVSGPGLLGLTIEDFTGWRVDHFVVVGFDAFVEVIDRLGGIEICLGRSTRIRRDDRTVTLDAGCALRSGDEALRWMRDRVPEQLVDGEWVPAPGGDAARAQRQQQLLVELLRRLKRFRSPLELSELVEDLAGAFTLDDQLTLGRAIDLAWELRSIQPNTIRRPVLDVVETATEDGEFIRLPAESFADMLADAYPDG